METTMEPAAPELEAPLPKAKPLPIARETEQEAERDIKDWLQENFGGASSAVRLSLIRLEPKKTPDGITASGVIDEYEEFVEERDVRAKHGGGKYRMQVKTMNAQGKFVYAKARDFSVPGHPRFEASFPSTPAPAAAPPREVATLSEKAMTTLERQVEHERDRAEKERARADELASSRSSSGLADKALVDLIQAPILAQLQAERDRNAEMTKRFDKLEANAHHRDPVTTKLLESAVDGNSAQLDRVRTAHESELRTLRENHNEDLKRLDARHDKALDSLRESHGREMKTLEKSHEVALSSQKVSFEMRIDGLQAEIKRLERELTSKDTELGRLRAVKEKSVIDSMTEVLDLKEKMADAGLVKSSDDDEDEDDDKMPGWVRGIIGVLDSPMAQGMADRIAGGPPQGARQTPAEAQQQAQMQAWVAQLPVGKAVDPGNGDHIIKLPNGKIVRYADYLKAQKDRARAKREAARAASPGAAPAAPGEPPVEDNQPLRVSHEDMARAIQFIEGAVASGTKPEDFAASAVSLAPKPVIKAIRKQTVEWFLEQCEDIADPASIIFTQAGRDWMRKLHAILKGGAA